MEIFSSCEHVLDEKGFPIESFFSFILDSKEVLNINSMPKNTFLLSQKKKNIRDKGASLGSSWHTKTFFSLAAVELSEIIYEKNSVKSAARKKMNKDKIVSVEQKKVLEKIEEEYASDLFALTKFIEDNRNNFLYDKCEIDVGCSPPTKRILDPPNLYPTIKAFIDGLTDSGWWEDDNFNYIQSMRFHYQQPTLAGKYVFYIRIRKVSEHV